MGFRDELLIEVTCADTASCLSALIEAEIRLRQVVFRDGLRFRAVVRKKDWLVLNKIVEKKGGTASIRKEKGFTSGWLKLGKRPALLFLLLLQVILVFYIPSRVLFVQVEGNEIMPAAKILESAQYSGVFPGATRKKIRNESVKNSLLEAFPDLAWAAVNTTGCVATISVREKTVDELSKSTPRHVSSIVAACDGIVSSCSIRQGKLVCNSGQAVRKGEVLISGYTDCGLSIRAERAEGEIQALTQREIHAVTPVERTVRGAKNCDRRIFYLRIGKKVIKLSQGSGISDVRCVKIQSQTQMVLPGGFVLPCAIITEHIIGYAEAYVPMQEEDALSDLNGAARDTLLNTMIAGSIIAENTQLLVSEDVYTLHGRYVCLEMIGRERIEETLLKNE